MKIGQSYTSTNNEADPSLSGENVSLAKSERGRHGTRNSGSKRRAADFFDIDEDSPSTKKRSISSSDETDSGREARARHHKSGEDRYAPVEVVQEMNIWFAVHHVLHRSVPRTKETNPTPFCHRTQAECQG